MFFSEEDQEVLEFQCPVLEAGLTVEELLSLLQPAGDSINNNSQNSGSEGSTGRGAVYSVDERKRRRMISNRESARRSRWRKKKHLEELTEQANRLKQENREIKNRLGLVAHRCHVAWRENDHLSAEFLALRSRLSDLCQILVAVQSSQQ